VTKEKRQIKEHLSHTGNTIYGVIDRLHSRELLDVTVPVLQLENKRSPVASVS